ncbi:hypothetical protein [Pelomonas cellulosilytica]|uniref:Uncharacterized protein n=1 Tax=Pelomonas cellulosilytica TaxID=2906762 RepID=A0ABS8XSY5_9BURK|nr:hypothetical protein [Pelomonas sp. P8]MCE4554007.1 hypothetical protein [Pelomonas sp. P8]
MPFKLFVVAALVLTIARPAAAQTAPLIPPNKPVAGVSQEEWSKRWWRWALSFDDEDSPVADPDGRYCASGQDGPVWFLAGTYGTARTVRTCHVPAGKTLFFPLVNYVTFEPDDEDESCVSLKQRAARLTPKPDALVLEVNGKRFTGLEAHRQATRRCFHPSDEDDTLAAGNGFYVALGPLKKGRYTLNFGGILPELSQAVTYTLDVE